MVLYHLVLHDAHSGLLDGGFREGDASLVGGRSRGEEYPVHLLLRVESELALRFAYLGHSRVKRLDTIDDPLFLRCLFCHSQHSCPVLPK